MSPNPEPSANLAGMLRPSRSLDAFTSTQGIAGCWESRAEQGGSGTTYRAASPGKPSSRVGGIASWYKLLWLPSKASRVMPAGNVTTGERLSFNRKGPRCPP